jgi:hypothetical protein
MGILIQTQFDTAEGIPIANVYCKITSFTCDIVSSSRVQVILKFDTFVSREKRLVGYRKLHTPNVPEYIVFPTPLDSGWTSLPALYTTLKDTLATMGFAVEDVLEPPVEEPPVEEPPVEEPPVEEEPPVAETAEVTESPVEEPPVETAAVE